jgi:7-cyano-7-deazaguanine synthase
MPGFPRKAVVLLSGGLDSTTTLAIAQSDGFDVHAMTFRYGQRHAVEVEAARRVAAHFGVSHHMVVDIDLRVFAGSALTGDADVPKNRRIEEMSRGIPATYVPARNTIFLSFALAWAEALTCVDIFIGVNALDYSGYPDCRLEYIEAFQRLANLATKASVEGGRHVVIHAPLITLRKADIIRRGLELGVDYSLTSSCYDPGPRGEPCGLCDSCLLREKGFAEAGIEDPIRYAGKAAGGARVPCKMGVIRKGEPDSQSRQPERMFSE